MEDILTTLARQFLPQMEPEERAEAPRSLRKMADEEFFTLALGDQPEHAEASCPQCGPWHVVKKGHEPDGSQRYLCRSYTRTFTSRTNKVFATTKLDRATWMRFAECHIDALTLRESAERCGVSMKTAFFTRHRVLECTAQNMPAFRSAAGDGMEIGERHLRESFKGNGRNAAYGIPRKARRQPHAIDRYEQICVLAGVNDTGDFLFEMAGRGNITEGRAAAYLEGKVASGAIAATDGARAYIK